MDHHLRAHSVKLSQLLDIFLVFPPSDVVGDQLVDVDVDELVLLGNLLSEALFLRAGRPEQNDALRAFGSF